MFDDFLTLQRLKSSKTTYLLLHRAPTQILTVKYSVRMLERAAYEFNKRGAIRGTSKRAKYEYDLLLILNKKYIVSKCRKENPQKLTHLSSRSYPRHLVGNSTAQKDTIIDITSDSQVNSNFPYRWSPASLTFNNYFYLFLYL